MKTTTIKAKKSKSQENAPVKVYIKNNKVFVSFGTKTMMKLLGNDKVLIDLGISNPEAYRNQVYDSFKRVFN